MAGPRACHSPSRNPLPVYKNELTGAAPTEGSGTPTLTPIVSRASTPAPATTPDAVPSFDSKLFKQFIKAYLKTQVLGRIEVDSEPCEQSFKAQFPDLYYGNLHMDCYQFCHQCQDYFENAGAKGPNRIRFAALFLRR